MNALKLAFPRISILDLVVFPPNAFKFVKKYIESSVFFLLKLI